MSHKTFEIQVSEIYEESLACCIEICDIHPETVRGKKVLEKCKEARERFCIDCTVKVVVIPFPGECVQKDAFIIKDKTINCNGLETLSSSRIIGGYMYTIFVDALDYTLMTAMQMYYVECWLSAYAEATWKGIKTILMKESIKDFAANEYQENLFLSESFAPGFGMKMKSIQELFDLMNLSEYGMKLQGDHLLLPSKSIIGIYLIHF